MHISSPTKILREDVPVCSNFQSCAVPQLGPYSSVYMHPYKTMTPPKAHCHPASSMSFTSLSTTPFIPVVFAPTSTPLLNHSSSSPMGLFSNDQTSSNIHPAFRHPSAFTQLTYSDPKWTFYNPLASIMCLQPANFVTSPYTAITTATKELETEDEADTLDDETEDIEVV